MVEDPDPGVSWKALGLLASAPDGVVRAARDQALQDDPASARAKALAVLADASSSQRVIVALADGDVGLQRYAAAAAARVVGRDSQPLRAALKSRDEVVRQFASDMAARAGVVL